MYTRIHKLIIPAIGILMAACSRSPEDSVQGIYNGGKAYMEALDSGNLEHIAKNTNEIMMKKCGGDPKVILAAWGHGPLRKERFRLSLCKVDMPPVPQVVGNTWFSFVPVYRVFDYDDGGDIGKMKLFGPTRIQMSSYLLATSTDKGKTWLYSEAPQKRDALDLMYPEYVDRLVVPNILFSFQTQ